MTSSCMIELSRGNSFTPIISVSIYQFQTSRNTYLQYSVHFNEYIEQIQIPGGSYY